MINRVCISINNTCNLRCKYCHFHEKESNIKVNNMDIIEILDNIKEYIKQYDIKLFKIGFVGNGEPLINYNELKQYIEYLSDEVKSGIVSIYTITNGLLLTSEMLYFFKEYNVNVGFSIDGIIQVHNKWRCNSFEKVMKKINLFRDVLGYYPSMNCTVGRDVIDYTQETIEFFKQFKNKITFSRMIGKYGISLDEFNKFLDIASNELLVRRGGYDCTMYGGKCAAGINNYFYANGEVYICGNCVDLKYAFPSSTPLDQIQFEIPNFERNKCFKEVNSCE